MRSKVESLLIDIDKYTPKSLEENIKNRLDKTLKLYLENLDAAYDNLRSSNVKSVFRRLSDD